MDYDGDGSPDNEQYTEKRNFHRLSSRQIQRLEAYFKECTQPDESQRQNLSRELDLEINRIKFWFKNKRAQSKVQNVRTSNILLRAENEKFQCENDAMREALENVTCPPCGGPPLGRDERERYLQELRQLNALLKKERDILADSVAKTMMDSLTSVQRRQTFESLTPNRPLERPSSSESQTIHPQPLSQVEITQLSETAKSAVEELKWLFFTDEAHLWVMSSIDGISVIEQDSYEKFLNSVKRFRNPSARVESSKSETVVPIEATSLIHIFLDTEKWKTLFPTIVNKAREIHKLGSELRVWEQQLHILSPLVTPREFKIVRCCQNIDEGFWIIADVSHSIVGSDHQARPFCDKRPSGVLIQALPNTQTKVTWIEHVEVDNTSGAHWWYRDLVSGGSGYGAKRWIVTLERMCERMTFSSIPDMPATDWGEIIRTVEERKSVMELGERLMKKFNEMLIMPEDLVFPQQSECGRVIISTRMNMEAGQPTGLVASAASCLSIPLPPLQVFKRLNDFRHQWDIFCHGNAITEVARVFTGSSETNYINILQPTLPGDVGKNMVQEQEKSTMMVLLQECYMDALGGMIVFARINMDLMSIVASGEVDTLKIPILPSGITISSDGRGSMDGGTLLTLAFQFLPLDQNVDEKTVFDVNIWISETVQSIKRLFNLLPE